MDTILIIGGRLQAVQRAKELGLRVVLLQHKDRLIPGQAEAADALLLIDYLDWPATRPIVKAAHEVYGFTKVVSLVDQAMELVGRINDMLGLDGTSYEVSHRFHDKLTMRRHLMETGLEDVAAEEVRGAADLHDFGTRHGYPFVLKPVDGTASRGVVFIDGPERIDEIWKQAHDLRDRTDLPMAKFYPVDRYIAEQFIDGIEYSVEAFSFAGRHSIIAITDKINWGPIEIGHAQPARLTPRDEAALVDHMKQFLTAMGLRDGISCTEIKLTPRGPRVVESHDRVIGERVMDLVEAIYGIDIEQYAVGWPFRLVPELPDRPVPDGAAATRFLTADPGTVVAIEGAEEVRARPDVLDLDIAVGVGDEVPPLKDNFDRPGQVLVTAPDTTSAIELCKQLTDKIRIVTRSGE